MTETLGKIILEVAQEKAQKKLLRFLLKKHEKRLLTRGRGFPPRKRKKTK